MKVNPSRVALFLDFENLYQALNALAQQGDNQFEPLPGVDFEYLVASIHQRYGLLEPEDFIVAAYAAQYNMQLGGLNRLATLIDLESLLPRSLRKEQQKLDGKKQSVHHHAGMALAYAAGKHLETRMADIYLFISADGSLASVGKLIQQQGKLVEFILPDPERSSLLKTLFTCQAFSDFQPAPGSQREEKKESERLAECSAGKTAEIVAWVQQLRRELHTAIPLELVLVMLGSDSQRLLERARSEMEIDLWENDSGISCISLRSERLAGKVVKMETRPGVYLAGKVLYQAAQVNAHLAHAIGRADWRKLIKEQANLTNSEAKLWLELLFDNGVLKDGLYGQMHLKIGDVIGFVQRAEKMLAGG